MDDFKGKSLQEKIDCIKKELEDVAINISVRVGEMERK